MEKIEAAIHEDRALQDRALTVEQKPPSTRYGKDYNQMLGGKLAERPAPAHACKERSVTR